MAYEDLNRMFDRVKLSREREEAILADLLSEKKEVASMKKNTKRKIPGLTLVAAVLALVLAGTALAAGYMERVRISPVDDYYGDSSGQEGYAVDMPEGCIPAASLSEEVLTGCPGEGEGRSLSMTFDSRAEAEAFLGLDLSDNVEWEEISKQSNWTNQKQWDTCMVDVHYSPDAPENLPTSISVTTAYNKENCYVGEIVYCVTDAALPNTDPDAFGIMVPFYGETEFQEYVTANGIEATISKDVIPEDNFGYGRTFYAAHFIRNNLLHTLLVHSSDAWVVGRENSEFFDPWDMLVEILEAYQ